MCGRYTLTATPDDLARAFGIELEFDWQPRYNIAPTQSVPIIFEEEPDTGPTATLARWGLVPGWADDLRIGNRLINARSETAHEKPAFRAAYARRRCLVLADGWYEWQKTDAGKVPHWFHREDRRPFAFAGLWERWTPEEGEPVTSCTILTAPATADHEHIHGRRPVVLDAASREQWLAVLPQSIRLSILAREPQGIAVRAVSTLVNSPRNDVPECIAAVT